MVFNAKDYDQYDKYIVLEIEEGFVHVQLNNPKTLNSFAEKTWRDYHEIFSKLDADADTKVILVSSNVPKSFSSGLDLKEAMEVFKHDENATEKDIQDKLHQHIVDFQYCIGTPARITTPTIGILNGINYGLALDMAACYSIRIAVEGCRFSIREIKIGLTADIGSLQRLPALINNKSRLYQHALLGDIWGADEAHNLGFVSQVVPDLKAGVDLGIEIGSDINGNLPAAIKGTKKHLQDILDGGSVEKGLADVAIYNKIHLSNGFKL